MDALKTVLVDALRASATRFAEVNTYTIEGVTTLEIADTAAEFYFDADRLAEAVRDHFLDREKVRASVLVALMTSSIALDDQVTLINQLADDDLFLDRFIEVMTGKAGDA